MPRTQRILVATLQGNAANAGLLQGIAHFQQMRPTWRIRYASPEHVTGQTLQDWRPDGLIMAIHDRRMLPPLQRYARPVVNVSSSIRVQPFARVHPDNLGIGRMAAEHLYEQGLREFAYLGCTRPLYAEDRWLGLQRALQDKGVPETAIHRAPSGLAIDEWPDEASELALATWLEQLPRPCGLFAVSDPLAVTAIEACRRRGLAVPDEVAVIGVEDTALLCESTIPPLSSIRLPWHHLGWTAAEQLDRLLADLPCAEGAMVEVPPLEVRARASTDLQAMGDPELARVLGRIHENLHRPLGVAELTRDLGITRRTLEKRFRHLIGRSPLEHIRRLKMQRASRLLLDSELPVAQIGRMVGYDDPSWFGQAFRRECGSSPGRFRQRYRPPIYSEETPVARSRRSEGG